MKYLKIFIVLIMGLSLAGCNKKTNNSEDNEVKVENLKITFEENPSTGYLWSYSIGDKEVLEIVKDEYVETNTDENIVGAPGERVYEIKGLKKGETTIVFKYSRSFEDDTVKENSYVIEVDDNLNATIKNEYEMNY